MNKLLRRLKPAALMAVLTVVLAASGFVSEAKTINKKKVLDKKISYVGEEIDYDGDFDLDDVTSVKINNKKTSKYKKKVKVSKTDSDPTGFQYYTKAYFKDSDAYNSWSEYYDAKEETYKNVGTGDYTLRFLKAGTYTISYVDYSKEYLDMEYDSQKYVAGEYVSYYRLEDADGKLSSELFEQKVVNGEYYYQGVSSKKIYAEDDRDWGDVVVAASIRTGADKQQHVYCQPRNVVKTTYSRQYKVLKTSNVISSVQLGKTKLTRADSKGAYSSSGSSRRSFLSGKSGKLTVKAADKNYSITSIVVKTYDKEGKPVYTKVGNKKKVNYGQYKYKSSYSSPSGSYSYSYGSHYKETTVYVFYKNKFTGAFTRVNSISKDEDGDYVFSVTSRNAGDKKDTTGTSSGISYYDNYVSYTFYKK